MKTILVVEDDPAIVCALTFLLEVNDYKVCLSEDNGKDIEARLTSDHPDVILMDMYLAGEDGREITKELKADPVFRQIPIVMLSAHPKAQEDAKRAGADAFLAKPFDIDDLLSTVSSQIQKHPTQSSSHLL